MYGPRADMIQRIKLKRLASEALQGAILTVTAKRKKLSSKTPAELTVYHQHSPPAEMRVSAQAATTLLRPMRQDPRAGEQVEERSSRRGEADPEEEQRAEAAQVVDEPSQGRPSDLRNEPGQGTTHKSGH